MKLEKQAKNNKWLILLTVSLGSFMSTLDGSIVNLAYPTLTKVFDTEPSIVLWVSVTYFLVSTGLMPILGSIGDMFGRKKLYIIGFIFFNVGLGLCSLSTSIVQLILFRVIQAVGFAILVSIGYALVTASFPDEERGKALGIMAGVIMAGPLVGPVLGGFFLDTLEWRAIFYARIPVGIIIMVMAWLFLKEQKAESLGTKLDFRGAAILSGSVACLLLFFNFGGRFGFSELPVPVFALLATALLTLFVFLEKRVRNPVIDLSLFRNRPFTINIITLFIQNITLAVFMLVTPFFLIDGNGFTALETGLFFAIPPLVSVGVAPLSGWLSDKGLSRILIIAGIALTCLGMFLFSRLGGDISISEVIPTLILFGVGISLFRSPNTSQIMGVVPRDRLGSAAALMNTVQQIGLSSGLAIAGAIFTSRKVTHGIRLAPEIIDPLMLEKLSLVASFQDSMLFAAIFCGLGLLISVLPAKADNRPV
ncbi:MFS transporter [Chloroflexota bacterium]